MSAEKAGEEARRWYDTAVDDLQTAQILCDCGKYAQCCFHCQQAAEKAMKAVYYTADADPWGHSVLKLVQMLGESGIADKSFANLTDGARRLDQYYVPTRYPNGLPGTIPSQAYGENDAKLALDAAMAILDAVNTALNKKRK